MSHVLPNLTAQQVIANISDSELARKANLPVYRIVQVKNGGSISPEASQRIADVLGVSLATLGKGDR